MAAQRKTHRPGVYLSCETKRAYHRRSCRRTVRPTAQNYCHATSNSPLIARRWDCARCIREALSPTHRKPAVARELKGTASEPVRDVKGVVISLYPQDEVVRWNVPSCRVRRDCGGAPPATFRSHVATRRFRQGVGHGGRWPPRTSRSRSRNYGSGLVVSASFSNEAEE